ncbi:hypothetical protein ACFX2J_013584 [Malus domestica]
MVKGEPFHFTLEPYGPITPDRCKTRTGFRNILCSIQKEQRGWWKRLLKTEEKPAPYIILRGIGLRMNWTEGELK